MQDQDQRIVHNLLHLLLTVERTFFKNLDLELRVEKVASLQLLLVGINFLATGQMSDNFSSFYC